MYLLIYNDEGYIIFLATSIRHLIALIIRILFKIPHISKVKVGKLYTGWFIRNHTKITEEPAHHSTVPQVQEHFMA